MNRLTRIPTLVVASATMLSLGIASPKQAIIDVRGPTVLAFFTPVTQSQLEKDGTNEALSDFQYYAGKVRPQLQRAGIEFQEVYARSIRIRIGASVSTFRPHKIEVGYYLIAPGRKPRVEYGVLTDDDLLQLSKEYFGASPK